MFKTLGCIPLVSTYRSREITLSFGSCNVVDIVYISRGKLKGGLVHYKKWAGCFQNQRSAVRIQ